MNLLAFALSGTHTSILLGAAWLAAGAIVASALARRGHPPATAVSAVAAWPLLLPLLGERPAMPRRPGPLATRIGEVFDALHRTFEETGDGGGFTDDASGLREALLRADERVGLVDRLLADVGDGGAPRSAGALREARGRAVDEIDAVLSEVVDLRLQVGLLTLQGQTDAIRGRLAELRARAGALDEVARLTAG